MSVAQQLDLLLADIGTQRLFIVYELRPKADGGTDKVPVDPWTREPIDCHVEANRFTGADAALHVLSTKPGPGAIGQGIGLVLPVDAGYFFVDLDHAYDPITQQWAAYVPGVLARFPGAYVETSQSGTGLHILGRYTGARPAFKTRCRPLAAECYTGDRFCALTGYHAAGSILSDHTAALHTFLIENFSTKDEAADIAGWTTGPVDGARPLTDDNELLSRALRSTSAKSVFGAGVSFADLWHASDKLAVAFPSQGAGDFDHSAADLALANHLAFWTGSDCERVLRLMQQSRLARDKWGRDDYIRGTILMACRDQRTWYIDRVSELPASSSLQPSPGISPQPSTAPSSSAPAAPFNPYLRPFLPKEDFISVMSDGNYLYRPTREHWPKKSVEIACGAGVVDMIDKETPAHQFIWAPGVDEYVKDRLLISGGWVDKTGVGAFNLYQPPLPCNGNAHDVQPWLDHLARIYPDDAYHLVRWLAHRAQRPGEKINHAIVLGGGSGIGKDTVLEPVKIAIGPWNAQEIAPAALFGRFNGFVKSVILRVSEVKGDDVNPFDFYEVTKTLIAAPPDVLRVDEKNVTEHMVMNVTGVVLTTNHLVGGLFLPPEDRRHYVAWSNAVEIDMTPHCAALWAWYNAGGLANVVAYLRTVDINDFNPKAPPPKTEAWHAIVGNSQNPDSEDLSAALEAMGRPAVLSISQLIKSMGDGAGGRAFLMDPRNRRSLPHRMSECGYVRYTNPEAKGSGGRWRVIGESQKVTLYRRTDADSETAFTAARALTG